MTTVTMNSTLRSTTKLLRQLTQYTSKRYQTAPASVQKLQHTKHASQANTTTNPYYPGSSCAFTDTLTVHSPTPVIDAYRILDTYGKLVNNDYQIKLSNEELVQIYRYMVELQCMDNIFYDAQRQGRISFYMQNSGEEAIQIGSAAALSKHDMIFAQYREAGVLLHRGFTIEQFANQLFSTHVDVGKGRQMPVHYGSKALNWQTISSPLGTQLPQAAGAAYALKRENTNKPESEQRIVVCYFGEGAASEGDFAVAINMAATLSCPVLYFVRNNGYAISTPSKEQYRGDGIAARASGYGIKCIRVDGNDVLAVHEATAHARKLILETNQPIMLEAMTYRGGHHSTSDDSTRYRGVDEIAHWNDNENPVTRTRLLLESLKLWDSNQEQLIRKTSRKEVLKQLSAAERRQKPAMSELFNDVYDELPPHLIEQKQQLMEHLKIHGHKYGLDEFVAEK